MPGQPGPLPCRFIHKHSAKRRNRPVPIKTPAGLLENRVLHVGQVEWIKFQLLDLAVVQGRPFVAIGHGTGVTVVSSIAVQLHQHAIIVNRRFAQHDVVDALLQRVQCVVIHNLSKQQKAVLFEFGPLCFRYGL